MLADHDPDKWVYTEHAKVKHELLRDYLLPWARILATGPYGRDRLVYIDGFAGRGQYEEQGGTVVAGSPIIALQQAPVWLQYTREVELHFVEADETNFTNLASIVHSKAPTNPRIKIELWNRRYVDALDPILAKTPVTTPLFCFIDPFGFGGVPFETVRRVLQRPRAEVFFTLMVRDIGRFLRAPNREEVLTQLFGTDAWREIPSSTAGREIAIRDLYVQQLRKETRTQYIWTFRVCMDEKRQTIYYLVHATNHLRGIQLMKGIMRNQGKGIPGSFAFLGPEDFTTKHQLTLFDDPDDVEHLQQLLLSHFRGRSRTFTGCQEETIWFDHNPCVEKHYRKALKALEEQGVVRIQRVESKNTGLAGKDIIHFPGCSCHLCSRI